MKDKNMPTDAERIIAIKSQTLALIQQITLQPKPSYTIDAQTVSWTDYLTQLQATVAWCDRQLDGETPTEIRSQGMT
jgi:hypothetical protein